MTFVVVEAPGVVATLVASGEPRPVQIVITGVSPGQAVTVMAVANDQASTVPGGVISSATGGQIVLVDNRAPLNTPVIYRVWIDGKVYTSDPVTVTYSGQYLLQSLDGRDVVDFVLVSNGLPQEVVVRTVASDVPGRERPPMRYAPGGDGGGELVVRTSRLESETLRRLLKSGRPLVVRTDGEVRDFPPADIIQPQGGRSVLWDAVERGASGMRMATDRVWSIPYLFADDPEPSRPLAVYDWGDFNAAMVSLYAGGGNFNGLFTGQTWADFNTFDWAQL